MGPRGGCSRCWPSCGPSWMSLFTLQAGRGGAGSALLLCPCAAAARTTAAHQAQTSAGDAPELTEAHSTAAKCPIAALSCAAEAALNAHAASDARWSIHPLQERLKAEAQRAGLWNLWIPADMAASLALLLQEAAVPDAERQLLLGPGLTNLGERRWQPRALVRPATATWRCAQLFRAVQLACRAPCARYPPAGRPPPPLLQSMPTAPR